MRIKLKDIFLIASLALIPTFLVWLPFALRLRSFWSIPLPQAGMATIVANYDGPLFLIVAKTLYNQELIQALFQFPLPTEYYAAHFPLFPLLINAFAVIFGHVYSMLFVTLASSVLALYFFRKYATDFIDNKNANWLTLVFALLPARWLVVRSVGSAEPLFVAAIIASIYFFKKKKYLLAGLWGAAAQLTKSPAILLFVAYLFAILVPNFKVFATTKLSKWFEKLKLKSYYPLLLIPVSLVALFVFYAYRMGDFLAYFNSGDNIHLFFPPFQIFNYSAPWVGTFWLEEVVLVYLIAAFGLTKLAKKGMTAEAWFVGVFFASIIFVSHRDVIRYALPVVPFLIAAYSNSLVKKEFKIVMAIIFIPIYLFSLAYISQNVMPISNWAPFL